MKNKTTLVPFVEQERWSSYSALAQSFRKTHNDHELLRAAAKGALSVALPLAIATLPTQKAQAQAAVCSATSFPVTSLSDRYGYYFDVDQDGTNDVFIGYFYRGATFRQLIAYPVNGAAIAASSGPYLNYAENIGNGVTIPGTFSFLSFGVVYSTYGGNAYGNFQPGGTPSGNLAIQTASGNVGWVGLTVTAIDGYIVTFIGFEGSAPASNGGSDGFGVAVIGDCGTLPVELTYFKAQAAEKTIQLAWATESETNNAGFEIQRSKDGERFHKIGFVKGHGTTVEAQQYAFEDNKAFANTTYYYRLKQVDDDGTFAYSEVQTVILKKEKEIEISDLFPNPATTEVQLRINTASAGTAVIELFNSTGQQLRSFQKGVQAGTNTLNLHLADLPKGTYFAKVKVGEQQVYKKLVLAD